MQGQLGESQRLPQSNTPMYPVGRGRILQPLVFMVKS